jgi:hypothetical protein
MVLILALVAGALLFGAGYLSVAAQASQTAKLKASLTPNRLGAETTFAFGIKIETTDGQTPSPLAGFNLSLPAGLGLFTSTLGQEICEPGILLARGVKGCSPDAIVGFGSAFVEVAVGTEKIEVPIKMTIIMGPPQNHHTGMLYYAEAQSDVIAELVFPGLVLGATDPFGTLLTTTIPVIAGLPDEPDAAVTQMQAKIGAKGLLYSKRSHGKVVTYHPEGMLVPERCPPGGFPFAATFEFEDGTSTTATVSTPCPRRRSR